MKMTPTRKQWKCSLCSWLSNLIAAADGDVDELVAGVLMPRMLQLLLRCPLLMPWFSRLPDVFANVAAVLAQRNP